MYRGAFAEYPFELCEAVLAYRLTIQDALRVSDNSSYTIIWAVLSTVLYVLVRFD